MKINNAADSFSMIKASTEVLDEIRSRMPVSTNWREVLARVDSLPSLPQVAMQALQLIDNPQATGAQLNRLIEQDVGLATRILRLANSAIFARASAIATLPQAITLLGFQTLRGIILAASLTKFASLDENLRELLWRHSIGVGLLSRHIGRELKRADAEELFVCGMLHNVGQLALAHSAPQQYSQVLCEIEEAEVEYTAVEEKMFGAAHPILGALLVRKWNLSNHVARVILSYQDASNPADDGPDSKVDAQARVVRIADLICFQAGIGTPPGFPVSISELTHLMRNLSPAGRAAPNLDPTILKEKAQALIIQEFSAYH